MNKYISELATICKTYPLEEKILILNNYQSGHQILEQLARSGVPWINFRLSNIVSLANTVMEDTIIKNKLRFISSSEIELITEDIYYSLDCSGNLLYFKKHAINKGIVECLASTIADLRLCGITSGSINKNIFVDTKKANDIQLILNEYETILMKKKYIDTAEILLAAINRIKTASVKHTSKYIILSNQSFRELEKQFIINIAANNLIIIQGNPIPGFGSIPKSFRHNNSGIPETPDTDASRLIWLFDHENAPAPFNDGSLDIFHAIGYENEIRNVLRRISSNKLNLDDAEIIHTDTENYGNIIYSLCEKLNIPVCFAEGIPGSLTAPGRALFGFLMWLKDDFAEIHLRRLIESGDIKAGTENDNISSHGLAGLLRSSGIGWGKDRYAKILEQRIAEHRQFLNEAINSKDDNKILYYQQTVKHYELLKSLCLKLLNCTPEPDKENKIDFKLFCDGCINFAAEHTKITDINAAEYVSVIKDRLSRAGAFSENKMPTEEAIEKLINIFSGIMINSSGPKPGHLFVSHYKRGGLSGRNNTFIVGLDESRFPGKGVQDPILLDEERKRLKQDLDTSDEKIRKNLFIMASLITGLKGNLTVSYCAYDIVRNRKIFPSSIVLQIFRIKEHNPKATYKDMFKELGEPTGYNNIELNNTLDETELWLSMLASTDIPKNGADLALNVYPELKRGMDAVKARESSQLTEYDGKITPQNDLDPRKNKKNVISCSRIETAAKCPFSYFLKYVLNIRPPEETAKDVTLWLDAMERGHLLHEVYQQFAESLINQRNLNYKDKYKRISQILAAKVNEYKQKNPPPNDIIFQNEYTQMQRDIKVFIDLNEELKTTQIFCELKFGMDNKDKVSITLDNGKEFSLRGSVDRVDKIANHQYSVWDYKTGGNSDMEENGYINGCEKIQHILYAIAVEEILKSQGIDDNPQVIQSGYIFPTEKGTKDGRGGIFRRDPSQKDKWKPALTILMDLIANGAFFVSEKAKCNFCEYSEVCGGETSRNRIKQKTGNFLAQWQKLKDYE